MLTVQTIAKALNMEYTGKDFQVVKTVTDSRLAGEGCLFAAIVGERVDGHSFIADLDDRFESMVFLGTHPKPADLRNPYFQVEDIQKALGLLAKAHLAALPAKVVAVTGSVGKTTTKNFILSALAPAMQVSGTKGNQNNELGVPLTGLAVAETDQAAVVEMGMRGLGQITYLTQFITPDIAVITNIGVAHLELLKSRENIAKAKLELADALPKGGKALMNGDEPLLYQARPEKECYYFGKESHNDYRAEKIEGNGFTLYYPGGCLEVTLQVEGEHQVMNALAAFGVGHLLGVDPNLLKEGIEQFTGDGTRQFTETVGGVTVIDDSYNASPDSMRAALKVLAGKGGRKVAVLGDMLELGSYEEEGHRQVGAFCGELGIDVVLAAGAAAKTLYEALPEQMVKFYTPHKEDLDSLLEQVIRPGDTVLFKASNSMGFRAFAEGLKERMKKNL
ncbi:MAG: UDP-N-acetylmuramoyl-tripeptide--D-alanyl-D-alanine ligase [Clostridia bacterium]|nr:UDP-N-acetylmuramoyl-tripeptide--D-alanyl-D-alanine ligase [Clostridia bacterium]